MKRKKNALTIKRLLRESTRPKIRKGGGGEGFVLFLEGLGSLRIRVRVAMAALP